MPPVPGLEGISNSCRVIDEYPCNPMQVRVLPSAVLLVSQFSCRPPMHLPHILVEVRLTKWRLLCLLDHRFWLCTNIGRYPFNYSQSLLLKRGKIEKVREQSLSTFIGRTHLDIRHGTRNVHQKSLDVGSRCLWTYRIGSSKN